MTEPDDETYDRERMALYITGLLPGDVAEARAVLDLCAELLLALATSAQRRGGDDRGG